MNEVELKEIEAKYVQQMREDVEREDSEGARICVAFNIRDLLWELGMDKAGAYVRDFLC